MTIHVEKIFIPTSVALISAFILLIIRSIAFRFVHTWAGRTETGIDNIIIESLKTTSILSF